MTKSKVGWDESIPPEVAAMWLWWLTSLHNMDFHIPRCIIPGEAVNVEFHVCSDASMIAYGACAYIRVTGREGGVCVTLVMSYTGDAGACTYDPTRRVAGCCHSFQHRQLPDECAQGRDFSRSLLHGQHSGSSLVEPSCEALPSVCGQSCALSAFQFECHPVALHNYQHE